MGLKVKGCLLMYDGATSCEVCTGSPQSATSLLHHGARYIIPFSKEFPHFEVRKRIIASVSCSSLQAGVLILISEGWIFLFA